VEAAQHQRATHQPVTDQPQQQPEQHSQQACGAPPPLLALLSRRLVARPPGGAAALRDGAAFLDEWAAAGGRQCVGTLQRALEAAGRGDAAALALPAQALQDVSGGVGSAWRVLLNLGASSTPAPDQPLKPPPLPLLPTPQPHRSAGSSCTAATGRVSQSPGGTPTPWPPSW
jgi:hypothetical protein